MSNEDYPVCEGCGEKHPPMTAEDAYRLAVAEILSEAMKVTAAKPGEYPDLEQAIARANTAATAVMAERYRGLLLKMQGGAGAPRKESGEPGGTPEHGLYL